MKKTILMLFGLILISTNTFSEEWLEVPLTISIKGFDYRFDEELSAYIIEGDIYNSKEYLCSLSFENPIPIYYGRFSNICEKNYMMVDIQTGESTQVSKNTLKIGFFKKGGILANDNEYKFSIKLGNAAFGSIPIQVDE